MNNFMLGLTVGVGVGLLWAPNEGSSTRRQLAEQAGKLRDYPRRKLQGEIEFGREQAGEIGRKVAENAFDETKRRVVGQNWP